MNTPRIAIVTGCAGDIGHGIAFQLAEDGCKIVVNDLENRIPDLNSLVNEINSRGGKSIAMSVMWLLKAM
jgi:NAD(P)-dependent dehydrogenase (short-subunit alcohol dehydrogenase family)